VAATGDNLNIGSLDMRGATNFDASTIITFTGGYIRNNEPGGTTVNLTDAEVIVNGSAYMFNGCDDDLQVNNDFSVTGGYFILYDGSSLTHTPAGNHTFLLTNSRPLYVRGADNFPTGFQTYTLDDGTRVEYDMLDDQIVRGGDNLSYYNLRVEYDGLGGGASGTKTLDGNLYIRGWLDMNDAITLDLDGYNFEFRGTVIQNETGSSVTTSGGTFYLKNYDNNQTIQNAGGGTYTFNNIEITSYSLTDARTIFLQDNITTLNTQGNFSVTNTGGDAANILYLDMGTYYIKNCTGMSFPVQLGDCAGPGTFLVGANVEIITTGATSFASSAYSFTTKDINENSTIRFNGAAQTIPGNFSYGNIELEGSGIKQSDNPLNIKGDFSRTNDDPVFQDNGKTHTIQGNWNMGYAYTTANSMTGKIIFNGTNQLVSESYFGDIQFSNGGTKTLAGDIDLNDKAASDGDLTIDNGVTVLATTRNITLEGDWINPGTGVFTQTTGTVTFDGTTGDQDIDMNISGYFGNVVMSGTGTLTANTNLDVNHSFTLNSGTFDLNGKTLYLAEHWDLNNAVFIHNNGKIHFDGAVGQDIYNGNGGTQPYYDFEFSGAGYKEFNENTFTVEHNFTNNGSVVNGQNLQILVAGDWVNTGTFDHNERVIFNGADQDIGASTFHDVEIAGSGTKTLSGNISLDGAMYLTTPGATLDVGAGNYGVNIEEYWTNTGGSFNPGTGTVTFVGSAYSFITSNGEPFFNIDVNKSANDARQVDDLDIDGNLIISLGAFRTRDMALNIAGSLINSGSFYHEDGTTVTFDGASGTHDIDYGGNNAYNITIDGTAGVVYELESDLTMVTNYDLNINTGKFDLNGHVFTTGDYCEVNITGANGILEVDAGATLICDREVDITNDGGTLTVVGDVSDAATVTSNQTRDDRYLRIFQNSGTLEMQYYQVSKIRGNGIQ
ncbi:MAG: hypothetical protein KJ607_07430, partial [Bacteroidetes bacterium]|nr:hypothetical protein [Bacteroidota bacterium]